jgi:HPt (histidine-containing phosphotransfer) domain-containing protein
MDVAMSGTDNDPIDAQILDDLASKVGGRGAGFHNVVQAYVDAAGPLVTQLAEAARSGRVDEAARHAHTLKSSSSWVGATALAAMCRRIEADPPAATPEMAGDLEAEHARVVRSLAKVLDDTKDAA